LPLSARPRRAPKDAKEGEGIAELVFFAFPCGRGREKEEKGGGGRVCGPDRFFLWLYEKNWVAKTGVLLPQPLNSRKKRGKGRRRACAWSGLLCLLLHLFPTQKGKKKKSKVRIAPSESVSLSTFLLSWGRGGEGGGRERRPRF